MMHRKKNLLSNITKKSKKISSNSYQELMQNNSLNVSFLFDFCNNFLFILFSFHSLTQYLSVYLCFVLHYIKDFRLRNRILTVIGHQMKELSKINAHHVHMTFFYIPLSIFDCSIICFIL